MAKRAVHPRNRNFRTWHHPLKVSPNIRRILPWVPAAANLLNCFRRKVASFCSVHVRFQLLTQKSQGSGGHLSPENLHYHTRKEKRNFKDYIRRLIFKDWILRLDLKFRLYFFEARYAPSSHRRLHVSSFVLCLTSTSPLPDPTEQTSRLRLRLHSAHGDERLYNELGREVKLKRSLKI